MKKICGLFLVFALFGGVKLESMFVGDAGKEKLIFGSLEQKELTDDQKGALESACLQAVNSIPNLVATNFADIWCEYMAIDCLIPAAYQLEIVVLFKIMAEEIQKLLNPLNMYVEPRVDEFGIEYFELCVNARMKVQPDAVSYRNEFKSWLRERLSVVSLSATREGLYGFLGTEKHERYLQFINQFVRKIIFDQLYKPLYEKRLKELNLENNGYALFFVHNTLMAFIIQKGTEIPADAPCLDVFKTIFPFRYVPPREYTSDLFSVGRSVGDCILGVFH